MMNVDVIDGLRLEFCRQTCPKNRMDKCLCALQPRLARVSQRKNQNLCDISSFSPQQP